MDTKLMGDAIKIAIIGVLIGGILIGLVIAAVVYFIW